MLAELHHKWAEADTDALLREDLLTADVFGALKYLPRTVYLGEVLREIAAWNSDKLQFARHLQAAIEASRDASFKFWPQHATPADLPGERTEPDLEIHGDGIVIFVEAKFRSGFGKQQIEREIAIAAETAAGRQFFLILVTSGRRPTHRERSNERVLWISWQSIFTAIERAGQKFEREMGAASEQYRRAVDITADLIELMEMRELCPFRGFKRTLRGTMQSVLRRPILLREFTASVRCRLAPREIAPRWLWSAQIRRAATGRGVLGNSPS